MTDINDPPAVIQASVILDQLDLTVPCMRELAIGLLDIEACDEQGNPLGYAIRENTDNDPAVQRVLDACHGLTDGID